MSKKLKVIISLIVVLVMIGIIFGSLAIYRFFTFQKIFNKTDENISKENYYIKTTLTNGEEKTSTEAFYKDGIGKNIASNGVYTWVKDETAYMVDEENKKIYPLDISNNGNAIILVSNDMFASVIPGYYENIFGRVLLACNLNISISSEKIEEKECYKIKQKDNKSQKTIWITKDRKTPIKAELELTSGEKIIYDYEIKFNTTRITDVELPDISDYKVIDYKTGEEILDFAK